jgi:hypothetical protein
MVAFLGSSQFGPPVVLASELFFDPFGRPRLRRQAVRWDS